ncbi:Glycosyl transferase, group 2 protein [Pseudomonas savastanoi pv. glycinea]|uniref:Glycosyl transferase, group 2 family protein n=3 Tax=Pseudomonas savastanoi TaxID=29438 RepID=A0ABD4BK46_PSESH|nr:Glycosyl transferase, group 2 family protein [Pseudomonas savastanoi pv. phaseolicola]RMQ63220.1 Glycosyl transferase, group 2 protein [Pseudomonas savastanoi pv. glycinea]RMR81856.1 Glycosyl transferase, group 2 protein [Pseudomonas savastanoi pv. glycinea]RMT07446.1 Glycosyl transferase, group 2 protein [Pseudomonas savastanoi pv. phaseolicola]RMV57757.1 Glycosyl transferase, group 2 protein [Pseudomonas savastanoi pv. glycinea]
MAMSSSRLVSIVIPAYKPAFFEAALASALRQNHDDIEIIITDDCRDDGIKAIVEKLSPNSRWPIHYFKNATPLGEPHNIAHAIARAQGEYIKFLYDDDILLPDCVRLMFDVMHDSPDIKVVSATRKRIDANGALLADNLYTAYPFGKNVVLNGPELVSFLASHPINFVGEPSAVMCRREDLLVFGQDIMSLQQVLIWGLGDLAMYVKLLRHGNLAMLARPLSYFRVSDQQSSEAFRKDPTLPREGHANFRRIPTELGWVRPDEFNGKVKVAPLSQRDNIQEMDLLAYFDRRPEATVRNTRVAGWLAQRRPTPAQHVLLEEYLQQHNGGPAVAIVVSDFNQQPESVLSTLQSLASDAPLLDKLKVFVLADYDREQQTPLQAQLPWRNASMENRATVINALMQENDQAWWILVDAGTTFTSSGLLCAVMKMIETPEACAVFGDEVTLHAQAGAHLAFRPDFSLDYLLTCPAATSRNWLFNREKALEVGGFDPAHAQAIELDLILRMIEGSGYTEFAHSCEPMIISPLWQAQENYDQARTVQRHLHVRGYPGSKVHALESGLYRIDYGHADQPLVSILVTSQDQLETLLPCVESILENTTYPHYEILICDNNSQSAQTTQWLATIDSMQSERIRIVRHEQALSPSALLNSAAEHALGDYLVMLDSHALIIQQDWLNHLLNHALRPEVGVVGAKLISTDGNVVQAGIIMGLNGTAATVTASDIAGSASDAQRLETDQNYSAVSGSCLMIRKSVHEEVQGLDEHLFPLHFNDVDLCLKARSTGHLVVWTPHAIVALRPDDAQSDVEALDFATRALYHRWLHYMAWDPAYNKNLTLTDSFVAQSNPQLSWRPLTHRPLPVVLALPCNHAAAGNRISTALQSLGAERETDGIISHAPLPFVEIARLSPDTVVIQGPVNESLIASINAIKDHTNAWVAYDLPHYPAYAEIDKSAVPLATVQASLRHGLARADLITVPTTALAELLEGSHPNVQVIETRLAPEPWRNLQSQRQTRPRPRVGWVGTAAETGDLLILSEVIKALADRVEWVIMGPCTRWLRPYIHELRSPVEGTLFPGTLASLNLDLVLAPAESNLINTSKSPVALLEFGACGFPVICSDVLSVPEDLPVTRVENETNAWVSAIERHIDQLDECARKGDALRQAVIDNWMLEADHLQAWRDAWLKG